MEGIDFARIAKVALTGAVVAVAADYMYANYGEEARTLITEFIGLLVDGDISDFPGQEDDASA